MRIALATASVVPKEFDDDELLAAALTRRRASASFVSWDDAGADWNSFDRVVIRSTWDYTSRLEEFLEWAAALGERVRNRSALVRWNSDKRYLEDLAAGGLSVVPTSYVEPGGRPPELSGEVVVKPVVSAGARDTGRFAAEHHGAARRLLTRLAAGRRVAMVQPYLGSIDERGETALVFIAGRFSHALRKRAVLRPGEEAPVREDSLGAAEAMYDPQLVTTGEADEAHHRLGAAVVEWVGERFGGLPLYARVDTVPGADGSPTVLELEAVEPCLYLKTAPAAADRLAEAILADGP